ncbi:MAG: response regulator [Elusimicrobia bacterium]|nr:response regulator [Elusimicrobiota bacterium]
MGKKILIIEDNPLNRELMLTILKSRGYELKSLEDAKGAVEIIKEFKPDLLLLDIMLPGIDGLTLTSEIRNDPDIKDLKIIAVTAYAMRGDKERIIEAGCDGYISKPLDTRKLPGQVEEYLNK